MTEVQLCLMDGLGSNHRHPDQSQPLLGWCGSAASTPVDHSVDLPLRPQVMMGEFAAASEVCTRFLAAAASHRTIDWAQLFTPVPFFAQHTFYIQVGP